MSEILICPVCAAPLSVGAGVICCPNGHSFDRAREGYVNLLRTKRHGDSREMLRARRAFLDRGHYAPLAGAVNALIARALAAPRTPAAMPPASHAPSASTGSAHLDPPPTESRTGFSGMPPPPTGSAGVSPAPSLDTPNLNPSSPTSTGPAPANAPALRSLNVLDAGCGEGYYLDRLKHHLTAVRPDLTLGYWGLDSSRDAIRLAARRNRTLSLLVADIKDRLPFATGSLQVVLSIFAPRHAAEFARVLAPDGLLLLVIPGPEHLRELRDSLELLAMEENKRDHVIATHAPWFTLSEEDDLALALDLEPEDVRLLVTMSPSHRHVSDRRDTALQTLRRLQVTASFTLLAFRHL